LARSASDSGRAAGRRALPRRNRPLPSTSRASGLVRRQPGRSRSGSHGAPPATPQSPDQGTPGRSPPTRGPGNPRPQPPDARSRQVAVLALVGRRGFTFSRTTL
jgi:hypothetical protein